MALHNFVDQVSNELDRKQFSIGGFIDLSKAFDTPDHRILFVNFIIMALWALANNWFSNYLENRKQFVSIGTDFADTHVIKFGVPQESILLPLLF